MPEAKDSLLRQLLLLHLLLASSHYPYSQTLLEKRHNRG